MMTTLCWNLIKEIMPLKERILTAYNVARDFIKRRLYPLKSRITGTWLFLAEMDPT